MSFLWVYEDLNSRHQEEFSDPKIISDALASAGIRFEQWESDRILSANATQDEVLEAYEHSLQRIQREIGAVTADVISVQPEMAGIEALRKKFLDEHTHSEDEARFFVEGCGLFYLHLSPQVYIVLCEKGDFINVPSGTKHWFDMGPRPLLKAIRTFNTPDGWVASFTGSDIASRFPRFEALMGAFHELQRRTF